MTAKAIVRLMLIEVTATFLLVFGYMFALRYESQPFHGPRIGKVRAR